MRPTLSGYATLTATRSARWPSSDGRWHMIRQPEINADQMSCILGDLEPAIVSCHGITSRVNQGVAKTAAGRSRIPTLAFHAVD
jgi:hypothetical protein